MPKISVVMAVYNGEKFLEEAISSILNQTEKDFEFIVINDGSTDQGEQIIKNFQDDRIKHFSRPHQGLISSLNFGLSQAKGKYVARMDADDVSYPHRLKTQADYMDNNPEVGLCAGFAKVIDEKREVVGEMTYSPLTDISIRTQLLWRNPIIHPSVMIRKSTLDKVGYYRNWFRYVEDYELWTRVLAVSRGVTLPDYLLYYRWHSNQITPSTKWEMRWRGIVVRFLALFRSF